MKKTKTSPLTDGIKFITENDLKKILDKAEEEKNKISPHYNRKRAYIETQWILNGIKEAPERKPVDNPSEFVHVMGVNYGSKKYPEIIERAYSYYFDRDLYTDCTVDGKRRKDKVVCFVKGE
jgi:hypothetical protein